MGERQKQQGRYEMVSTNTANEGTRPCAATEEGPRPRGQEARIRESGGQVRSSAGRPAFSDPQRGRSSLISGVLLGLPASSDSFASKPLQPRPSWAAPAQLPPARRQLAVPRDVTQPSGTAASSGLRARLLGRPKSSGGDASPRQTVPQSPYGPQSKRRRA